MTTLNHPDEVFMREALKEASKAARKGEVPVGAVVVKDGKIIGRGHNLTEKKQSALTHAELMALGKASKKLKSWRLIDCDLYVTLEPCTMCAGAIVAARVERLVFAARDIRFGGVRSLFRLADSELQNHRVRVEEGLLAAEAGELLMDFFRARR